MTTKEEILALAGEPVAFITRHAKSHCVELDKEGAPYKNGWSAAFPVFTADQVIAARKPLEDEVERLRKDRGLEHDTANAHMFEAAELRQQLAAANAEIERLKVEARDACVGLSDYFGLQLAGANQLIAEQNRLGKERQEWALHTNEVIRGLNQQLAEKDEACRKWMLLAKGKEAPLADSVPIEQLAAAQAQIQQYREALETAWSVIDHKDSHAYLVASEALSQPQDTTALEAMIQKAGEVMRERCAATWLALPYESRVAVADLEIRALPGVTLEDL